MYNLYRKKWKPIVGDPQAIETMWVSYSKANSFTCSGVQSGILHAQLPFADNEADNDHLKYQFFWGTGQGPGLKAEEETGQNHHQTLPG